MARPPREIKEPRHPVKRGWLGNILHGGINVFSWILLACLFSIVAEWIGLTFYWPEEGVSHSQNMLIQELQYLGADFYPHPLVQDPAAFAWQWAEAVRNMFLSWAGKISAAASKVTVSNELSEIIQAVASFMARALLQIFQFFRVYLVSAYYIIQVVAVRLAVLTLAQPAFILTGLTAFCDGLMIREKRKMGVSRETDFYHWAKPFIKPSLIAPWIIYLSLPISVHPSLVILPFCLIFGIAIAIAAATYRKYI
ncbi:MAG TPA: TIGR03747 family integrating conjugative element membrane protein [Rhodobacteraceae bacterium]|nr:TIGR03747 family integrating conjugative element membrane protein [Paracoccaceae bacterium]